MPPAEIRTMPPRNIEEKNSEMKGPSERLKYDMRRIWECPICRHREGTGGHVTSLQCKCQAQVPAVSRQFMRLVQDGARRLIERRATTPRVEDSPEIPAADVVIAIATVAVESPLAETLIVETTIIATSQIEPTIPAPAMQDQNSPSPDE